MLVYCQFLLNFQGAQVLIQVRSLSNLEVVTTTSEQYATSFGFTEKEVFQALDHQELSDYKEKVKQWYDGFQFGNCTDIYNPWSITKFLNSENLQLIGQTPAAIV